MCSKIMELPEHIKVGRLELSGSLLEKLPAYLTVDGCLDLGHSSIKELGEHLTVWGSLDISDTAIQELPKHLWVGPEFWRASTIEAWGTDFLFLDGTSITTIPDDCHIEALMIGNNNIRAFGKNVEIVELILDDDRLLEGNLEELTVYNLYTGKGCADLTFALSVKPGRFIDINNLYHALPDNIDLDCELRINNSKLPSFPRNTRVVSLKLIDTSVPAIPSDLHIHSSMSITLAGKEVNCVLEEGCTFPEIDIIDTSIKTLPNNFSCESLAISYTPIEKLPDILKLRDSLYLNETNIKRLPSNLEVGGDLCIGSCEIIRIRDSVIKVGRDIVWKNALLDEWPESLHVFGCIYIAHSRIESLPDDFLVNGNLDISHTTAFPS